MKIYILIFHISIHIYKSQLCEKAKSCFNCSISKYNCFWNNNKCLPHGLNESLINSTYLSFPFISKQYYCINSEKNIDFFEEINQKTISLNITEDKLDNINYHIYCFKYLLIQNISLIFNFSEKYQINIFEISLFDNIKKTDILISQNNNDVNILSNYICLKITYLSNLNQTENLITFTLIKHNKNIKEEFINLSSFILLILLLFLSFLVLTLFIFCYKRNSNTNKEIIIDNQSKHKKNLSFSKDKNINTSLSKDNDSIDQNECDKTNCSELQEKYFQLSKDSFVEYNYETIDSFVHNLQDKEKKNKYLKAIIKTMPSFVINNKNSEFNGIFCSFCESKIKMNDKICFINCGHIFHFDCIYQQIITNEEYKCIICRENIII